MAYHIVMRIYGGIYTFVSQVKAFRVFKEMNNGKFYSVIFTHTHNFFSFVIVN